MLGFRCSDAAGRSSQILLFELEATAKMGAVGLEPTDPEGEGFTVPCNCRYATPPKKCWRKELNPQPSDYKSGALPIELLQHTKVKLITNASFFSQVLL